MNALVPSLNVSNKKVILSLPPALKSLLREGVINLLSGAFTLAPMYKFLSSNKNLIFACCFACVESEGKYCQNPEAPLLSFHSFSLRFASKTIGFSMKLTNTDLLVVWEKLWITKRKVIKTKIFFNRIYFDMYQR